MARWAESLVARVGKAAQLEAGRGAAQRAVARGGGSWGANMGMVALTGAAKGAWVDGVADTGVGADVEVGCEAASQAD